MSKKKQKGKEKPKEIKVRELVSDVNRAYCTAYQQSIYTQPTYYSYSAYAYTTPQSFYHHGAAALYPSSITKDTQDRSAKSYDKAFSQTRARIQKATKELKKAPSTKSKVSPSTDSDTSNSAEKTSDSGKWKPVKAVAGKLESKEENKKEVSGPPKVFVDNKRLSISPIKVPPKEKPLEVDETISSVNVPELGSSTKSSLKKLEQGVELSSNDSDTIFDQTSILDSDTERCLSSKEINFKSCNIVVNKKLTNLDDVIRDLQINAFQMANFNLKCFSRENSYSMFSIFQYFVQTRHLSFDLHDVCQKLLQSFPVTTPIGTLKRLFKRTYRRLQIEQLNPQYEELKCCLKIKIDELEPGEDVERIWNSQIEEAVIKLVKSKYKNICSMTQKVNYQRHWMDKFVNKIATDKSLWPDGGITFDFLREKIFRLFPKLYEDLVELYDELELEIKREFTRAMLNRSGEGVSPQKISNISTSQIQQIPLYTEKRHSSSRSSHHHESGYHERGYRRCSRSPRRKYRYRSKSKSSHRSSYDKYNSRSRSRRSRRNLRYHSDESQYSKSPTRRSSRKKRCSDDYDEHTSRTVKRAKYDSSPKEPTCFDSTLRHCELVIDPFKEQEEPVQQIKQVFETKDTAPVAPDSAIHNPDNQIKSILDELEESLSEEKNKSVPEESVTQQDKKKSEMLKESYGEMEVEVVKELLDTTVVLRIQGYLFEGAATTEEDALEDASYKALILAPYLLKTVL